MVWKFVQDNWRPALEIFILAVGIYFGSRFVRGTRGWPVVIGFVVLLAALALGATLLDLTVLRWLLDKASVFIILGALVIFQPELRRMLGELGNLHLFATSHEQRESIEVILQTCERLADVRIGALIAIEQSIQLQEAVESRIPVDCEATPEMLETIFFPNNAIHDGGVIIKSDRIAYAACIFPLSQRTDLSKSLGTRHRAALGLSEETDAVVVIVSEETGAISHAYKGQLVRGVTIEALRAFLTSLLVSPAPTRGVVEWLRSRFVERPKPASAADAKSETAAAPGPDGQMTKAMRNFLTKDLGWKMLSLALAVVIWYTINALSSDMRLINKPPEPSALIAFNDVPVLVVSAAADVRAFKVDPEVVQVTVKGNADIVAVLQKNEIHVVVDLTGIETAPYLKARVDVSVPPGMTVDRVVPAEVDVVVPPK